MANTDTFTKPRPTPTVRVLPECEPQALPAPPDEDDAFVPPQRWSSLRASRAPAVELPVGQPENAWPCRYGNGHPANAHLTALLARILEALDGRRQVDQLRGILVDTVYEAALTRARTAAPARVRHHLRSLHSWRLTPDVIEVCGLVETFRGARRQRARAIAARIELDHMTWRCTVLRMT